MRMLFSNNFSIKILLLISLFSSCKKSIELSTVTTSPMSSVGIKIATGGEGNVIDQGSSIVIEKGYCWSDSESPTIDNNRRSVGYGIGAFPIDLSNLSANTKYYVRAYAKNLFGIGYGNQISFITLPPSTPVISTSLVSSITQTTCISGGKIYEDEGAPIISRGVCWSTAMFPTIDNNITIDGSGIGDFVSNITGLTSKTTYYLRAYAQNSAGVGYGNWVTFTTQ
jgi:hypothetical protein